MGAVEATSFDLNQFSVYLRTAFYTTKRAWSELKPEVCRHVMTPGLVSDPLRGTQVHDCPSCGAPFDVGDDGRCRSCGRHVTAGEFDWILADIEVPPTGGEALASD